MKAIKPQLSYKARRRFRSLGKPHVERYETYTNYGSGLTVGRLRHKMPRRKFFCDGCYDQSSHQRSAGMLRIDLWMRVAGDPGVFLCEACVKRRLGRPFMPYDFKQPWWDYQLLPSMVDKN